MTRPHIPALLEVHRDELAWLAGERRTLLHSARHDLRHWAEHGERMEAHLQGLLVPPAAALRDLMAPDLDGGDRDAAFAAAWAFLRRGDAPLLEAVIAAVETATPPALAGLRDAMSVLPAPWPAALQAAWSRWLRHADPRRVVTAVVVLANQGALREGAAPLNDLLGHEDPEVVSLAWRAVAVLDGAQGATAPARPFLAGVSHAVPAVRDATWAAAAWTGQSLALPLLRQRAQAGDEVALHWLSVLGGAAEVDLLQGACAAPADVPRAWSRVARHGHPAHLEPCLVAMASSDVALAAAAHEAFTRITGWDVRGERVRLPPPPQADAIEREMAPEVWLADVDHARARLSAPAVPWDSAARWCAGRALPDLPDRELLAVLDLQARWDAVYRAAWHGQRVSRPAPIH